MAPSTIREGHGNILDADVDALVNTVNTVGVMGKGLALQFKRAYPDMFKAYARAAKASDVQLGRMHVFETGKLNGPKLIINFPTKGHWRSNSRLADIEAGLQDLVRVLHDRGVRSVAVPPLGCGNGGLEWSQVKPLIERALRDIDGTEVMLYPPEGAPPPREMATAEDPPRMTSGKAAMVSMIARYFELTLQVSQIEVQKLAYFLQVAGEPLNLSFARNRYGPYADNLRKSLRAMEGHFIIGFGDGSKPVTNADPIEALPGAVDKAAEMLDAHPETRSRIDRVMELATGYESTYGMELLATVHWVATNDPVAHGPTEASHQVADWNARKRSMFTAEHVDRAWGHLASLDWLPAACGV